MEPIDHHNDWIARVSRLASCLMLGLSLCGGCRLPSREAVLPVGNVLQRDQLVVHSDFYIPSKHRLIEELVMRRHDISEQLKLPLSNEPINLYVFRSEADYEEFMRRAHPDFPKRRAFFVKNDTTLTVYAFWGERIGEDLRHEVTHGYLHSVISRMPLWLDEGLAEYFETPRGTRGWNGQHVYLLSNAFRRGDWAPDLIQLEQLDAPESMSQMHYAESWLWVHYLLESPDVEARLLQDQLARLRMSAESEPLSKFIDMAISDKNERLIEHLKSLVETL